MTDLELFPVSTCCRRVISYHRGFGPGVDGRRLLLLKTWNVQLSFPLSLEASSLSPWKTHSCSDYQSTLLQSLVETLSGEATTEVILF